MPRSPDRSTNDDRQVTTGPAFNNCRINFRDGRFLVITDGGPSGEVDHDRTPIYRDFVQALHLRLAQAPAGTIAFNAGASAGRHTVMVVTGVIAALFFVGTPLVLVFIVRDLARAAHARGTRGLHLAVLEGDRG